jgi:hypothetical protein
VVTRRGPQKRPQLEAYKLQSNLSTTSYPIAPSEFPKRWSTKRVPGCYAVASINIHPSSGEYSYLVNARKAATKQNTPQRIRDRVIARGQPSPKTPKLPSYCNNRQDFSSHCEPTQCQNVDLFRAEAGNKEKPSIQACADQS